MMMQIEGHTPMRTTPGFHCAVLLAAACGFAGCRSTNTFSRMDRSQDPAIIERAGHDDSKPGRIVTLEPEIEEVEEKSGWSNLGSKLLNPFSKPKKRIPLPLSKSLADNSDDDTSPGF